MKTKKEIQQQIKDITSLYKNLKDVSFQYYTAYKNALNWVLGEE